jgi:2,4-dienoyl-CoA reductase (NADPH2)
LSVREVAAVVDGFARSARNVAAAGYGGIEIHAAHGYLVAQFLSAETNLREDLYGGDLAGRFRLLEELIAAIRDAAAGLALGVRLSVEPGLGIPELAEIAGLIGTTVDWVNVTVGPRGDYVRDMATDVPPLLGAFGPIRAACAAPLLISQAFRERSEIEAALDQGADLVGMARPYIADPDVARKLLDGRDSEIRPCVSCNEDCRLFDPILLCSVNPDLALPGEAARRAQPLVVGHGGVRADGPVAVVGGGVGGLECAMTLARAGREVVLYELSDALGGATALAAQAPHRRGWQRLLSFYEHNLGTVDVRFGPATSGDLEAAAEIVLATGATEVLPSLEGGGNLIGSSEAIARGLGGAERVVIADDGFGWWPGINVLELAVAAGADVTFLTPSGTFAGGLPHESRTQLLPRLAGARLRTLSFLDPVAVDADGMFVRHRLTGTTEKLLADLVVVVGERRPSALTVDLPSDVRVQRIGDSVVPRRVSHAVAEGRAAAAAIVAA